VIHAIARRPTERPGSVQLFARCGFLRHQSLSLSLLNQPHSFTYISCPRAEHTTSDNYGLLIPDADGFPRGDKVARDTVSPYRISAFRKHFETGER
jgi:hypothetical protein